MPIAHRIGGTLTVDNLPITQTTDTGYEIKVTKPDGTEYVSVGPKDVDGLNSFDKYIKNIPILHETHQSGGAAPTVKDPDTGEIITPGETAVIHVYHLGEELYFQSHAGLEFPVGEEGSLPTEIDLDVRTCEPGTGDIDEDSMITPGDAQNAYRHFRRLITLDDCPQVHADVDGDGSITPADAQCIYRYFRHLSSCLAP